MRCAGGGAGDVGAEWTAPTVPPGLQRAGLRAGLAQPLLPVHSLGRPAVRRGANPTVPGGARAEQGKRGAVVSARSPSKIIGCAFLALCAGLLLAACGENMGANSKLKPYEPVAFSADGQSAQQTISGTVALGMLRDDDLLYTGKVDGQLATTFPFTV